MKTPNSPTRKDKQTQTLGDGQDSSISQNHSDSSEDPSEESCASRSDTVDSDQSRSPSMLVRGRHRSFDSQSGIRLQARNQPTTVEAYLSKLSESSAVNSKSIHASTIETDGDSAWSTSEVHTFASDTEELSAQLTSELEGRLQDVRIRTREACIRSLNLTSRAQLLVQRIRLEQIRSYGF